MQQNLLDDLKEALEKDESLVVDGQLNKALIEQKALALDKEFLKLLISSEALYDHFFEDIDGTLIFDKVKFQQFVQNKSFLPDSYTAFKNKIGLTSNGDYLSKRGDVVLAWPHKDCVLQGGQDKEDAKRDEIFWNETLAPDDIDRLLAPKVFTNWKKYDKDGEHEVEKPSLNDNYLIKGNNLLALHSLAEVYRGKVKLIYIDPPYNTGNDDFGYNDRFNHSSWYTFMKNRLEIAKEMLSNDGSLWINIDDDECHYLKVLADEVFGRENFVNNVVWEKKYTIANDAKYFSDVHDHILIYSKSKNAFKINGLPRTDKMNKAYTNPDNHPKGPWKSTPLHAKSGSDKSEKFEYTFKNGVIWSPPAGTYPRFSKETLKEMDSNDEIWFGVKGDAMPSRKTFLSDLEENSLTPKTLFSFSEVGHNHEAKEELKKLFEGNIFSTPKPERLLQRVLHLGSDESDIVCDFFLGSGTTAAVAHKMGRRYIGIEQMDYVEDVTKKRLKKVIEGEQGGISKEVEWNGGGSFVYAELKKANQLWVDEIQTAKNEKTLAAIWEKMKEKAFISYKVNPKEIDENAEEFSKLSLNDQKRFLIEVLDKNLLYVNYSEMDDADFAVSEKDKELNRSFYQLS
jgi:adenine-specific DNA-methyltransferase